MPQAPVVIAERWLCILASVAVLSSAMDGVVLDVDDDALGAPSARGSSGLRRAEQWSWMLTLRISRGAPPHPPAQKFKRELAHNRPSTVA
eukprot:15463102-Alexandrium_andersonii.AAC.1